MARSTVLLFIGILLLISRSSSAQIAVCGNGIREAGEQCDDGNTRNMDGCSSQCKFEQNQRINQYKLQFSTSTLCTANAFGSGIVGAAAQSSFQSAVDAGIANGASSMIFVMSDLQDLSGLNGALQVGVINATPIAAPPGVTYNGNSDLDWWYTADPSSIDASRAPTASLNGLITSSVLNAGPGYATLNMDFGSPSPLQMFSMRISVINGVSGAPSTSVGGPPGHLAAEHLDPALKSYITSGGSISGELCGNIRASSLADTPAPAAVVGCGGLTNCSQCYAAANSLLDVLVGGCTVGLFTTEITPHQPDQQDPLVTAGAGGPYVLLAPNGHVVSVCHDKTGATVTLSTCLDAAAYSSFFKFSTDRVIVGPPGSCPSTPTPIASNNGPICSGQTLQLTASGASGSYNWTGPNGFTSTLQNATIPNVMSVASGTYNVTVSVGGCPSAPAQTTVTVNATPATPGITAPPSLAAGATGTASVSANAGSTYAWTITNGSITAGQGTGQITFTAGVAGTLDLHVSETNATCTSGQAAISVSVTGTKRIVSADFNGDGKSDIILRNSITGAIAEYQMSGTAIVTGAIIGNPGTPYSVATIGDYNGDTKADLTLQNTSTNDVAIWLMDGNSLTSGVLVGNPGAGWKAVGSGDFNGDGKSDIILYNTITGNIAVWLMNGGTIMSGAVLGTPGTAYVFVAAADFNGDGKADVLLQNTSTGDMAVWLMDGVTITGGLVIGGSGPSWKSIAAADTNADGKADIFLRNQTTGDIALWQMNGFMILSGTVVGSPGAAYDMAGVGDYNGDGNADIVLRNTSNGDIAMWLLNGGTIMGGALVATPGVDWAPVVK